MNIQRFHALTSREALAKARMTFGDGTLILSNRPTDTGVEVVATGEDGLGGLEAAALSSKGRGSSVPLTRTTQTSARPPLSGNSTETGVAEDATKLAMSTLSFQDYVRERMLKRRHEVSRDQTQELTQWQRPKTAEPAPAAAFVPRRPEASAPRSPIEVPTTRKAAQPPAPVFAPSGLSRELVVELQGMKELIEDRFNTLTWLGQTRQHPVQSNLMLKLIRAGYSPALARTILEKLPQDVGAAESFHWVMDVLERNLKTDAMTNGLQDTGGIYALVGATGVGKTTSTAKLAAQCLRIHGPGSVGLITLDTYRVGAHEQLRAYGRMMGVVAHLAHDRAALQDLLDLLRGKKMVLIDTTGLAPRDARKKDMLELLDLPGIQRLLVLNAGGQGESLDEVVGSFRSDGIQQAILSKIDEAVKLGPVLDSAIRHQLMIRGVTTGQKVPEDWEQPDAAKLVRMSMQAPFKSAFDPKVEDLSYFFAPANAASTRGHLAA
jgi:flagellar biosynthesis protein FlhF